MNSTTGRILFGLTLVGLGLSGCGSGLTSRSDNGAKPAMTHDQSLSVNDFQRVRGTRFLRAEITEEQPSRGLASSSGNGRLIRNLVFLDGDTLDSHKLFEQNSYLIVGATEYPNPDEGREEPIKNAESVTQWLVHEVVKADTNGNGQLDLKDQRTIGLTDAGGAGYTELLSGLDQLLSVSMTTPGKLVVVYARDGTRSASLVDLAQRKVVNTKPLIELGPDVRHPNKDQL